MTHFTKITIWINITMYIAYVIINFTHLAAWTEKKILMFELVCLIVFKVSLSISVKD